MVKYISKTMLTLLFLVSTITVHRWGEMVYVEQSKNRLQGWGGEYKGKEAPLGVYTYEAVITYESHKKEVLRGNFNVLR